MEFFNVNTELTLIEVNQSSPELEIEIGAGISLIARLPTGADTEGTNFGETTVSGSGHSDTRFLALKADVDALLVDLLKKIPFPVTQGIAKVLENIVFAEFKFDLNDYIPFIPAETLTLEAKVLDIEAEAGAMLTEKTALDIANGGTTPNISIVLRSDNGTANDYSDDQVATGKLGESITIGAPTLAGTGTAKVTAYYDLAEAKFSHSVGVGLSAAITISALQAEIGGSIGSLLGISFGPLLEVEIPEGGINVDLFDFFHDDFGVAGGSYSNVTGGTNPTNWGYTPGAFNQNVAVYEVFFSDQAPVGWDQSQPGAVQALRTFAEAAQRNLTDVLASTAAITAGKTTVSLTTGSPNFTNTALGNRAIIWQGNVSSTVNYGNDLGNVLVASSVPATTTTGFSLVVRPLPGFGFAESYANELFGNPLAVADLLEHAQSVEIIVNGKTLSTTDSVNFVGTAFGDVLTYIGDEARYFDGAGGSDTFLANFAVSHPNDAITLDVQELRATTGGAKLSLHAMNGATPVAHEVTLKNIENVVLVTGDHDDFLTGDIGRDNFDTRGGDDFVHAFIDGSLEFYLLGTGDDAVVLDFRTAGGTGIGFAVGQEGYDEALITSNGARDIHWNIFADATPEVVFARTNGNLPDGNANYTGISTFESGAELESFYTALLAVVNPGAGLAARTAVDNYTISYLNRGPFIEVNYGDRAGGMVLLTPDIEAISVVGHAATNDLALFTGGAIYDGGAGGFDTFVADFSRFEDNTILSNAAGNQKTVAELQRGVAISADQARLATDGVVFGNSFVGGFERLVVTGTSFNDRLVGGALDDVLRGGAGNDVIEGGGGYNLLFGGEGNDRFNAGSVGYQIIDGSSVAADNDTLVFRADFGGPAANGLVYAFFDAGGANVGQFDAYADFNGLNVSSFLIQDGNQHAIVANFSGYTVFNGIESINVEGSDAFDDLLVYHGGASYDGGERAGDMDTFAADFRGQTIGITFIIDNADDTSYTLENGVHIAGIDRAFLKLSDENDVVRGGDFDDRFEGNGGNDAFNGGGGNDEIVGGAGDDLVYFQGFSGADYYEGGVGIDRLLISAQASDGTLLTDGAIAAFFRKVLPDGNVEDLIPGFVGAGSSSAELIAAVQALPQAGEFFHFVGSSNVRTREVEMAEVQGSWAYDDLVLYQGGLYYAGGERAGDHDVFLANLSGETTRLTLQVGDTPDPLEPTRAFNDIGNGAYVGEFESLFVVLGSGNDRATGGAFADYVDGGAGNDVIDTGLGNDAVEGGSGNDTVLYSGGQAVMRGGSDSDVLDIAAQTGGVTTLVLGGDRNLTIDPFASVTALRASLVNFFKGTTPNTDATTFQLNFGNGNSINYGQFERVNATGGAEVDVLVSGSAGGVLSGNGGNDLLIGQRGQDVMIGGDGEDTYVFGASYGQDVIAGEISGNSIIEMVNFARSKIVFSVIGDDLIIAQGTANKVTVIDYFAGGGNGLDFTFRFKDYTGKLNLSGLGAIPSGAKLAGVSIAGTAGTDVIENSGVGGTTANADRVDGGRGGDFIVGSAGSDVFDGSLGLDTVFYRDSAVGVEVDLATSLGRNGDAESDVLINIEGLMGSAHNDILRGNESDNSLAGGTGNDTLEGRGGADFLAGGDGDDTLRGDLGDDKLFGDAGIDNLSGGDGKDYLDGGEGNDTVNGDNGEDTLIAGDGIDILIGGNDNDTALYTDPGEGGLHTGGLDNFNGGSGIDTIDMSLFDYGVSIDLTKRTVTTTYGEAGPVSGGTRILDLVGVEWATGTIHDDRITGTTKADRLAGDFGDDWFTGGKEADTFLGGAGSDTVDYSKETGTLGITVTLSGAVEPQAGNLRLTSVVSGTVSDTFAFTDTLDSIERVIGTKRNDTFFGPGIVTGGDGADLFVDAYIVDYSKETGALAVNINLSNATGTDTFGKTDQLFSVYGVIGSSKADTLRGNGQLNTFTGGAGNDTIIGVRNDEIGDVVDYGRETGTRGVVVNLATGIATDTFNNTDTLSGIDRVFGTEQADTIIGGTSFQFFFGQGGDDTITGGTLSDVIEGGDGNDVLDPGADNFEDRLYGGAGDDRLIARTTQPNGQPEADLLDGGVGLDTVVIQSSADTTINLATGEINGAPRMQSIEGVLGGNGRDTIIGSDGDDIINGGNGDDTITGGLGYDTLTGGSIKSDFFVYRSIAEMFDEITDFKTTTSTTAADRLVLDGFDIESAQFFNDGAGGAYAVFEDNGEFGEIHFIGVTVAQLTAAWNAGLLFT